MVAFTGLLGGHFAFGDEERENWVVLCCIISPWHRDGQDRRWQRYLYSRDLSMRRAAMRGQAAHSIASISVE